MAPLALLVAIAAVGYVVTQNTGDEGNGAGGSSTGSQEREGTGTSTGERSETGARTTTTSEPRSYTVKSGDTLGMIAEQTGVSITELQELNPGLDPQSLTVGERIRLRR
jgi:LysM repeat protein